MESYPFDSKIVDVQEVVVKGITIRLPVGDRIFTAEQMASYLNTFFRSGISDGIYAKWSDQTTRKVLITAGSAIIRGYRIVLQAAEILTIPEGGTILLELDTSDDVRAITIKTVEGTAEKTENNLILCKHENGELTSLRGTESCPICSTRAPNQIIVSDTEPIGDDGVIWLKPIR